MKTLIRARRVAEWVRGQPPEPPALCRDCNVDVAPWDDMDGSSWQWYMVHASVWAAAGTDGILCIPCLEARLDRDLTGDDFPDLPINEPDFESDTPRLAWLKLEASLRRPVGTVVGRRLSEVVTGHGVTA